MKKINVDGYIIDEQEKWMYDLFEVPCFTQSKLRAFLDDAGGEDVELIINCFGGDVWSAASMYADLRAYEGKSTSKITGISASASSFMMLGTDRVTASPMATVMVHNAQSQASGDYRAMEHAAEFLKQTNETIINAYEIKTKKSRDELAKYMDNETFLTVQDALALGIIDEIDLKEGEKITDVKQSAIASSRIAACLSPGNMHKALEKLKALQSEAAQKGGFLVQEKPGDGEITNENRDESQPVSDMQKTLFHNIKTKLLEV